jgi:hypothetical protein
MQKSKSLPIRERRHCCTQCDAAERLVSRPLMEDHIVSHPPLQPLLLLLALNLLEVDRNDALAAAEETLKSGDVVVVEALAGVGVVLVLCQLLEAHTGTVNGVFEFFGPVALLGNSIALEAVAAAAGLDNRLDGRGAHLHECRGEARSDLVRGEIFGGEGEVLFDARIDRRRA